MSKHKTVITIGTFDGVHRGHKLLLEKTVEAAKKRKMKSLVITLEKPVRNVDGLLSCYKEKTELMKNYGIDGIAVIAVPSDVLNLSPDGFYEKILIKKLNAGHFVCGCDLSFGKDRKGNACWLKEKAKKDKIAVDIIKPLKVSSKKISSSAIRVFLRKGDIKNANKLLGREYSFYGIPFMEKGIGSKIGFPTVNLKTDKDKILPQGVFISIISHKDKAYPSVTSIGSRPTFDRGKKIVPETHILGFKGKWSKAETKVILLKKIRNEKKFADASALKRRISADISLARRFFNLK